MFFYSLEKQSSAKFLGRLVTGICGKEGDLWDFSATVRKFGRICTLEGRKGFRRIGFLNGISRLFLRRFGTLGLRIFLLYLMAIYLLEVQYVSIDVSKED